MAITFRYPPDTFERVASGRTVPARISKPDSGSGVMSGEHSAVRQLLCYGQNQEALCLKRMAFLNRLCMSAMYLAPSVFTRRYLAFALSKNSASVAAQCARVNARCCCSSRRELRGRSNRLTTGTANYTSRLLLHRPNWPTGSPGSEREESKWKRSDIGNWEARASTFETRIDIWWNSPRRAHGQCIDEICGES